MLLKLGTDTEKEQASELMNNYILTKANITSIIPDNCHSGATTSNAESTLERYQSQLEKFLHLDNIEKIPSQSKVPLQAESDDEYDGEEETHNSEDDPHVQPSMLIIINNPTTSPSTTVNTPHSSFNIKSQVTTLR